MKIYDDLLKEIKKHEKGDGLSVDERIDLTEKAFVVQHEAEKLLEMIHLLKDSDHAPEGIPTLPIDKIDPVESPKETEKPEEKIPSFSQFMRKNKEAEIVKMGEELGLPVDIKLKKKENAEIVYSAIYKK